MEPIYLQRLSFIKYLFSIGLYQSNQPEPLYGVSILSFHDSVELFLQLSLRKLNISKSSKSFMNYWEIIDNELKNTKLSQKESIRRLNKARVALKHHGIIPSKLDIESFRATTLAFFNENCNTIFQTDFDDISLIDIIKFEQSRELLKKAKSNFEKNLIEESLKNIALSFEYLISDYEESKRDRFHRSPFFFGKSMMFLDSFHYERGFKDGKIKDFVEIVTESIGAIQKAIKILSFGIDYKKYIKYKSIVPSVLFTTDGTPNYYIYDDITINKEDLEFCTNFIVESALKLQEFDFELELQ